MGELTVERIAVDSSHAGGWRNKRWYRRHRWFEGTGGAIGALYSTGAAVTLLGAGLVAGGTLLILGTGEARRSIAEGEPHPPARFLNRRDRLLVPPGSRRHVIDERLRGGLLDPHADVEVA